MSAINELPAYLHKAAGHYKLDKAREASQKQINWHGAVRHIEPHDKQILFIESPAKRKIIRAGRRGGKTFGVAELAVRVFEAGGRVLYATPTQDQIDTFWFQVKWALEKPIADGALHKNETLHIIEVPETKNRIRAKTAWNADMLRGDYGDLLILDEFQLMNEDTWGVVGAPMLLDNNGDAVFIYTPPSLHSKARTKARDPRHASKLYTKAEADTSGRWQALHFTSRDNPKLPREALDELTKDMTAQAIRQEIEAEDSAEAPGALWKRDLLEDLRVTEFPTLERVMIGVDPPGGVTECGIVAAGIASNGHAYVLKDASLQGSPETWSREVIATYNLHRADRVMGEKNFGGDMVEHTIRTAAGGDKISYKNANASRGKAIRAEPIAAQYERGLVHHVGSFHHLEDEMCGWIPGQGMPSPNRLDALVWALTELMLNEPEEITYDDAPSALNDWRG